MTTGNRFSFARRYIARAGEVTSKHSEQMVYICFGVFAYIYPPPQCTITIQRPSYLEFSAICSLKALIFGKKVSRFGKPAGSLVVWQRLEEGTGQHGRNKGTPVLGFRGFILPHTTRLRRLLRVFS